MGNGQSSDKNLNIVEEELLDDYEETVEELGYFENDCPII
jgi:hypothetical protein